ncbi:MAG: YedE family putative selenium transporter [Candidatus Bathyarchaeota archaeon]|nr:YedE family putative selenium transporter [Candidatus Termiticorpusculum sp.]
MQTKTNNIFEKIKWPLIGGIIATISAILVLLGNPANMGFCTACFLRDTTGALGLHNAAQVQYARPEIIGIILGAFIISLAKKEFAPKGGSAPITRFILGFAVMIGALIFLGCPLRMVLRIAGGDLNAIVGLFGFIAGIIGGCFFLKKGYTLKRTYNISKTDGFILPIAAISLLAVLLIAPSILFLSTTGPGSMHAPIIIALVAGLIIGIIGFASRLCFVAGIRDSILFKNFSMLGAFIAIIIVGIILNVALGKFALGFEGQPIAHTDGLWNFLGMALVGLGSTLLGGCPFRQLVLAGGGNSDSIIAVFGMITGAAFAHNFQMASSAAGVTGHGQIGLTIAFAIVILIAIFNTFGKKKTTGGTP